MRKYLKQLFAPNEDYMSSSGDGSDASGDEAEADLTDGEHN